MSCIWHGFRHWVYAEWIKDGHFDNGFFPSWDAYHDFTFDPEIEVKVVREIK